MELNLGISVLKNLKVSAWVLCKADFSSLQAAKSLEQKCKFIKKSFDRIADQRGITLVYPILDSRDLSLFSFEKESDLENLTIFNDRYPSDGWLFCEISTKNEWCYLPIEINKGFSKLNVEFKYNPQEGINTLIDNLFSSQRLRRVYKSDLPFYLEIGGLNKFNDFIDFEKKLKNILFINNLNLLSLKNNSATFSLNLLSDEKNLFDFFEEMSDLKLINKEKGKAVLAFGDK